MKNDVESIASQKGHYSLWQRVAFWKQRVAY